MRKTDLRWDRLLLRWANLPNVISAPGLGEIRQLTRQYPEIFRAIGIDPQRSLGAHEWFDWVALHLRAAWDEPDARKREWFIVVTRRVYADLMTSYKARQSRTTVLREPEGTGITWLQDGLVQSSGLFDRLGYWGGGVNPPPPLSEFEQAMFYFQRRLRDALHCGRAGCERPYFFRSAGREKFCSDGCAARFRSEYQSLWWAEKGKQRRLKKQSGKIRRPRGRPRKEKK